MKLSVVIPARNEEGCVEETLRNIAGVLQRERIPFEIVLVNDGSTDATEACVSRVAEEHREVRLVCNGGRNGFGFAVRCGLEVASGDAVAIMMADGSDDPEDLVRCYQKLMEGYDCVFGSRFIRGSRIIDYPIHKLVINRLANSFISILFAINFNDFTNAFKLYRREVIEGMQPIISPHFNLTVELPLKATVRGYSVGVLPIRWTNRTTGISKLKIREMGSRYLFIVLYIWLEKCLSRGDYHRTHLVPKSGEQAATQAHV